MDAQASAPSTGPRSRASTAVPESSDGGTPAPRQYQLTMTPSISTPTVSLLEGESGNDIRFPQANAADNFKPFQLLMETEINFEFGTDLEENKIFHEEMLCCHSEAARNLFQQAKALRQHYDRIDQVRKTLKHVVHSRVSDKAPGSRDKRTKTISSIAFAYTTWPFPAHRKELKQVVNEAFDDQLGKRNFASPQTQNKTQLAKKFEDVSIQQRLNALNSKGILEIAQALLEELRNIKETERESAKVDEQKAAAQRRYILRGVGMRAIRSLAHWMYRECGVIYEDAEHLYELYGLATKLGISALAEQCLVKLASSAEVCLVNAISRGVSLKHVLGSSAADREEDGDQVNLGDDFVQVIFSHVLKDNTPPERLVTLVTTTLAEQLTPDLWEILKDEMSHAISLRLVTAMVDRQQVKHEELGLLHFQRESAYPDQKHTRLEQHGKTEHI